MKNLQKLEEAVQRMLDGEKKRRTVAIDFISKVKEILLEVAPDIWGKGYDDMNAVYVQRRDADTGKLNTSIYFRYDWHYGHDCSESEGFYFADQCGFGMPVWGNPVSGYSGSDFWYMVQVILEWLPIVLEQMEKRSAGREQLLALINTEAAGQPGQQEPTAAE
mgnify:CR=1 FL=1